MKKILLVLSFTGTSESVLDFAVKRAKKDGAELVALYPLKDELANEVFDTFTDIGFIGERPSSQLSESIMKEQRQRGYEELGRVQVKAMEEGVPFEPLMEHGDYVKKVLGVIKRLDVAAAILVKKKKKTFLKYFHRSPVDEVREQAACEVVVLLTD